MYAIEEIYKSHANIVYKYLMTLTRDVHIAEELTQETFYQAMKSIHNFNGDCKLSSWLCQIAKYSWYGYAKKMGKEQPLAVEDWGFIVSDEPNPEDSVISKEQKIQLYRKLHVLDENVKEVVYLRLTGELSFKEIGSIFDKSENWARVTFYRAKQKLINKEDLCGNEN